MNILFAFLFPILGYLSGSLPFSIWVTRYVKNVDVRDAGSGHATTTNTIRQAGFGWGALVLILDIAKGFLPTYLTIHAGQYIISPYIIPLTAACAVIGHCWPLFAQFRGGMGLATFGGALLAANWFAFVIALGLLLFLTLTIHHGARSSVATGILMAPVFWLFNLRGMDFQIAIAGGLVTAYRFLMDWNRKYRELWLDPGATMKLGIVTDSTSDIPKYLIDQYELEVVPSILILDGKEYIDGISLSREDFYNRLPSLQTPPTTAAPSIGDFSTRYDSIFKRGYDHILSIHAAGLLTTIINSANQAAQDFPNKVTIVDSLSLSLGLGFQVLAAAEAAELGLQAALDAIESTRKRLHVSAALDTMENLRRSGRVPSAVAMLGSLLHIKPLIELTNGEVKAIGAVRTTKQATERMLKFLLEGGELERLAILRTGAEPRAKEFLNMLMQKASQFVPRDILMVNVTTAIGTHVGPNGLGFAAVRK